MERYGQSLEELLAKYDINNNINNTTDGTESSDEESEFHTPSSGCVAQVVSVKRYGKCVYILCLTAT